ESLAFPELPSYLIIPRTILSPTDEAPKVSPLRKGGRGGSVSTAHAASSSSACPRPAHTHGAYAPGSQSSILDPLVTPCFHYPTQLRPRQSESVATWKQNAVNHEKVSRYRTTFQILSLMCLGSRIALRQPQSSPRNAEK